MAITTVSRPGLSPIAPLEQNSFLQTLAQWLNLVPSRLLNQRIDTSTDSVPTGVATTVLNLPISNGLWLITVGIGPVGNAAAYQAMAFVFSDGTSTRLMLAQNGTNQTITLSGQAVQTTQSSGSSQTVNATAIQLTSF